MKYIYYYFIFISFSLVDLVNATNYQGFVEQKTAVPGVSYNTSVLGIPVNQAYSYGIGQQIADNNLQEQIDELKKEIATLQETIAALIEILEGQQDTDVNPEQPTEDSEKVKLEKLIVSDIFGKSCNSCHNGEAPKASLALLDNNGGLKPRYKLEDGTWRQFDLLDWYNLVDIVDSNTTNTDSLMPRGGEPLSSEQVQLLRDYIQVLKTE